jgi:hypothetical protein
MPRLRLPRSVIAKVANNIPEAIRAFEQLFDGLDEFADKQDTLVSGTNIKTINGTSILGPGNLSTAPTSIAWSIVTGTPTTLAGYGITDGGLADSFETVAANLDASGAAFSYSSGDLSQITYANGVVKSFAYGPDGLSTVTLSGALPSGINLIKSLSYTSGDLTAISYS